MLPEATVWSGMVPVATGASLGWTTVTRVRCVAVRPPGSVAVAVMEVLPSARAATDIRLPDTDTPAIRSKKVVAS